MYNSLNAQDARQFARQVKDSSAFCGRDARLCLYSYYLRANPSILLWIYNKCKLYNVLGCFDLLRTEAFD